MSVLPMASRVDPFPSTCDPECYVPRPATEAALAELAAALDGPAACTALIGPPGIGKTMLLRVLADRRKGDAQFVYLPYAALGIADLARWALGQMGDAPALPPDWQAHPVSALAGLARARAGGPLVLLLDDASALRPDTARQLAALVRDSGGSLRALVVPIEDGRAGRVLAALGSDMTQVRLDERLTQDELRDYVRARLEAAGADREVIEDFDASVIAWLRRESGGNPRILHELATRFLHDGGMGRPAALYRDAGLWLEVDPEEGSAETGTAEIEVHAALAERDADAEESPARETQARAAQRAPEDAAAEPSAASRGPGFKGRRWLMAALFAAALLAGWLVGSR